MMNNRVNLTVVGAISWLCLAAQADSMTLGGAFNMDHVSGTGSSNLELLLGRDNAWTICLDDVTFEYREEWHPIFFEDIKITRLHASSFTFEFSGQDADFLNDEVGQYFSEGGIYDGAFLEVTNEGEWGGIRFFFYIHPPDPSNGVYFSVDGDDESDAFPLDEQGFPIIVPTSLPATQVILFDRRESTDKNVAAGDGTFMIADGPCQPLELCELDSFTPDDNSPADDFGLSVAIDGDVIVVGAPRDDDDGSESGSAYVYRRNGTTWYQEAKLTSAFWSAAPDDRFGASVAASGDMIVIGAPLDDYLGAGNAGSAYVFRYNGSTWDPEAILVASIPTVGDEFGASVATDASVIVIGAPRDDQQDSDAGAVYYFEYDSLGGTWGLPQKLITTDGSAYDHFGTSVDVSGPWIVVGAPRTDFDCPGDVDCNSGTLYPFKDEGAGYNARQPFGASDAAKGDEFGSSVSLENDRLVVGSPGDDSNAGSIYFYHQLGLGWGEEQKRTAPTPTANDFFGVSTSLSGDVAIAGASGDDEAGSFAGAAHVFNLNGNTWSWAQAKLMASDAMADDALGYASAVDANFAIAAAQGNIDHEKAYVFAVAGDCDSNGRADACDVKDEVADDCNENSVPDGCDIADGTSEDEDGSGVPDECEIITLNPPGSPADPRHQARKHRYISIDPTTNGENAVAFRVELTDMWRCEGDLERACVLDSDCAESLSLCVQHPDVGSIWWVQASQIEPAICDMEPFARVDEWPYVSTWTEEVLHIGDCEIIPAATYEVRACDAFDIDVCSAPLAIGTIRAPFIAPGFRGNYGDVAGPVDPTTLEFSPPDGFDNVIDVQAYLQTVQNCGTSTKPTCHLTWVDLQGGGYGNPPNYILNVSDLQYIKFGLQGKKWTDTPGNLNPGSCP